MEEIVRKDIKKAVEALETALLHMEKVVNSDSTPSPVRDRVSKVIEAFTVDRDELLRIKDQHVM